MNSRFKQFGASFSTKRNSTRHRDNNSNLQPSNGVGHNPSNSTSSTTSLPMNPQNGLGRPPSYTYNPNAPRSNSPLPPQQQMAHHPPPIHTGGYPHGHPALGGSGQPPGYGGGYSQANGLGSAPQPTLGQYPSRGAPVEVEGAGRSKAQLIVGIDFVGFQTSMSLGFTQLTRFQGDHFLRCCLCLRNKHRGQRRHNHRMARCRQSNEAEGRLSSAHS